jgi:hypothetical protein
LREKRIQVSKSSRDLKTYQNEQLCLGQSETTYYLWSNIDQVDFPTFFRYKSIEIDIEKERQRATERDSGRERDRQKERERQAGNTDREKERSREIQKKSQNSKKGRNGEKQTKK